MYRTEEYKVLSSGRTSYATSATSDIKREQGLTYFIKYVLCLDTTMLRKFENENKNQNKKNLRLKIYEKIKNGTKCSYKKKNVYTRIYACRTDE